MKLFKSLKVILVAILIIGIAVPNSTEAAPNTSGNLLNITKTVSENILTKGKVTDVTLTVKGTPQDSTFVKPNDVILIIDKSGSMADDNRLDAAKDAAKEFINLMDLTKHKVGIVDYSTKASSFPLTTDKEAAKAYVDTIRLGGNTNTSEAIQVATATLANHRADAQPTIVIMTDGAANSHPEALAASSAAKNAGITFYSIALLGPNENPATSAPNLLLMDMASSAKHHHFVLGSVGLSDVYRKIVEEIGLASAYNVSITDTISSAFELVPGSYDNHIPRPTVTGNTITWFISELKTDELSFTYQIRAKNDAVAGKYPIAQTSTTFDIGDGLTKTLNSTNPIVEIKNLAPIITSITESKGIPAGGETVTITGENFLAGAKVYFGAKLATVTSVTDNEIVVTAPAGKQGTVIVKVENTDRQFAIGNYNYYADPTITSVSPAEGPFEGGNFVSISGSNFLPGAKVFFGDIEATYSFISGSRLIATSPAAAKSGLVSIKVVNPDMTNAKLVDAYTYLTPPPPPVLELDYLSMKSGKMIGGESINIFGKNFDRHVKIYFAGEEVPVTFISASRVNIKAPAATAPGLVSVKAENPDASFAVLEDAYEYLTPPLAPVIELSYLSVTSGLTTGGESIYIFGKNFDPNVKVYFGTEEIAATFISASKLRVDAPAATAPGFVSVKAENPDASFAVLEDAYKYLTPPPAPAVQLSHLSAISGLTTGGESIYIFGRNFNPQVKIYFGTEEVVVTFISASKLRVNVPAATAPGFVPVKAENPDASFSILDSAYEYLTPPPLPGPEITSISENTVLTGQPKSILLSGKNLESSSKVFIGDQEATFTFLSQTRVRVVVPISNVAGAVDVKVLNADGQFAVLTNGFTYTEPAPVLAPIITSLSSTAGSVAGNETVTISGQNFIRGVKVYFGDKAAGITFVSDTEITLRTPKVDHIGLFSVKVVNTDLQEATLQDAYLYQGIKPFIRSLSLDNGAATGGYSIVLFGGNFDKNMTVTVGGNTTTFTILADTRIRVAIPAGTPGIVDLTLELHGETATTQFTYN
ncbi:IPT/TIG domain-containing protein [Sporosarcina limicola]|uniref:VWFA domain-containing protein n=1 Tax=Sporosarcina limicola TaxID=34101 RepID=A0A927R3F1_9BACL|nr:IPT/TIG domain-containing protein [Sporosarcina limicola]MBE1555016.1 hypothetical protein [Sporosarcina limicola]